MIRKEPEDGKSRVELGLLGSAGGAGAAPGVELHVAAAGPIRDAEATKGRSRIGLQLAHRRVSPHATIADP